MNSYLKLKKKKIFDFAFGQGGLLKIASENFKCRKISGVEFSKTNHTQVKRLFNKKQNIHNTKGTPRINVGNWWLNAALYREYKFCFVMKHEIDHPLYITEKILLAFSANCIPIYHGPTLIFEFFNKNAFIFYNISDPQPSIDLIDSLNKNDTALQLMMEEPILAKGDETIEEFFSFGESIGKGKLRQKFRSMINGLD